MTGTAGFVPLACLSCCELGACWVFGAGEMVLRVCQGRYYHRIVFLYVWIQQVEPLGHSVAYLSQTNTITIAISSFLASQSLEILL